MYRKFYNLQQNPFRLTPDPRFVCMTGQHREALAGLVYSVCTRPGLTVLVGEVGTGKTTLIHTLLELLEKRNFSTAVCNNPLLARPEFYDLLLSEFGVECASSLKNRQLLALQKTLLRNRSDGRPSVLVVDEAQRLPLELLEEIRLLLNLETPREKLLEIIMAGQPELRELLRRPELRQLKQRVSYYCQLEPLSREDLRTYIHYRLSRAGLPNQTLFSEEAIRAIYEYSNGIPRIVNTLCDNALQNGFALQSPHIPLSVILEAAADLDLLPAPPCGDSLVRSELAVPLSVPARSEEPSLVTDSRRTDSGRNGREISPGRIPLESYAVGQKSYGFLAGLLDRWR